MTIKQKGSLLLTVPNLYSKSKQIDTIIHPFFTKSSKKLINQKQSYRSKQYKANPELAELARVRELAGL